MSEYYNKNASIYFNDTVNADVSELYGPFLEQIPYNAHILDAGCGSGRDTLYFLKKGYIVTSIDASDEIAKLAEEYTKHPVTVVRFQDIIWENEFDAIWACATLLHVPSTEIRTVFRKFSLALKTGGIIDGSFKYGSGERIKSDGRQFLDMNEVDLSNIINDIDSLRIEKTWTTGDVRPGRENEKWLNFIIRKK